MATCTGGLVSVGMVPKGTAPDGMAPDGMAPSGMEFSGTVSSGGVAGGGGVGGGSILVITVSSGGDGVGATLGSGECPDVGFSHGASGNVAGETDVCERRLTQLIDVAPDDETAGVEAAQLLEVVGVALFDLDGGLLDSRDNSAAAVWLLHGSTGGTGVDDAAAPSTRVLSALTEGCLPFLRAGF